MSRPPREDWNCTKRVDFRARVQWDRSVMEKERQRGYEKSVGRSPHSNSDRPPSVETVTISDDEDSMTTMRDAGAASWSAQIDGGERRRRIRSASNERGDYGRRRRNDEEDRSRRETQSRSRSRELFSAGAFRQCNGAFEHPPPPYPPSPSYGAADERNTVLTSPAVSTTVRSDRYSTSVLVSPLASTHAQFHDQLMGRPSYGDGGRSEWEREKEMDMKRMKMKMGMMEDEKRRNEEEMEWMRNENERMKKDNEWMKKQNGRMKGENGRVNDEMRRIEEDNVRLEEENERLIVENRWMREDNEEGKKENRRLMEDNERIEEENERVREENRSVKEKNLMIEDQNGQLEGENENMKEENEWLRKENGKKTDENEEIREENERIKEKLEKDTERISELGLRLGEDAKRIVELEEQLLSAAHKYEEATSNHFKTREDLDARHKEEMSMIQEERDKLDIACKRQAEELYDLQTVEEQMRKGLLKLQIQEQKMEEKMKEKDEEICARAKRVGQLERKVKQIEKEKKTQKDEIERMKREFSLFLLSGGENGKGAKRKRTVVTSDEDMKDGE
ncbi:hypothetical protein PFISCL1PPCAC_6705 [Pristionchus fissidentatus]|uniref:Uncharacterized protein n=1 Tax=Pristionchus fissidentatus TaxID=1538716 RepID=A0AAV5V882_9BILA|nr:hypothetical protein PFISCL1PPCAC_6705 [Pristionchus fissidentatus]